MSVGSKFVQTDDDRTVELSSGRLRWWGTMRVIGSLSFIAAVFVGVIDFVQADPSEAFGWVTIVIGNWVPDPLVVEVVLLAIGTVALLAALFIVPYPIERPWREFRIFVTVVLVVAVPVSFLAVLLGASTYMVLPEQSDGGCRIVVRDNSFRVIPSGSVGIVQPGSVTVDWLGDYSGDDGYSPFSGGTYTLDWKGKSAELEFTAGAYGWADWIRDQPTITCVR